MKANFVAINSSQANFDDIYSIGRKRPIGTRYVRVGSDERRVALEL